MKINTGNEGIKLLAGIIPLSELFNNGQDLEEYGKIRDKMINEALTKQGADSLSKNKEFQRLRDRFINEFLNKPSIQFRISENKRDIDKVRKGLQEDFDDMIRKLGGVEEISKHMEGDTEAERKKEAIKELFLLDENKELGEVLVGMVDEYYNNNKRKNNNI